MKAFAYSDEEGRAAKDVRDAFEAIFRHFDNEASAGTKDVAGILVKRYGLERSFANKEIVSPIKNLKV